VFRMLEGNTRHLTTLKNAKSYNIVWNA
jgi:hypothetical protein